ncbi:DnaB-like replicative helicase [Mycobacterium phage Anthony]|uniref:DnaB-like dsDNA helicase n=1 Tax=Mycobacterium phage Anthony TaxID=2599857 RepID=A0A5J6TI22_9CAUD|nr:DnaB-like replicative helicase [Mycobacterium phage Anthony]QFG10430.1 DnaB-like dsDNA helicase [Mycobacterium phage Anthony]
MQSLNIKGSAGDPLPTVFQALENNGTRFLRGQLGLTCAGPGCGKSAFILTYALKAKVPTMYFSADSDAFTQLSRMVSIQTGWTMEKSSRKVRDSDLGDVSSALDLPIRFNYMASPSLDQIELSMESYGELYEDYPSFVVVDNITNVRSGGANDEDPFSGLESMMEYLHDMARRTGAFVMGLHHVTGGYNDADKPIPLSGVKGQITRIPELVLTLHRVSEQFGSDSLRVSTVKNRAGKADPSGQEYAELEFIGDSMQIRDFAA